MSIRNLEEGWFKDLARNLVSLANDPDDDSTFKSLAEKLVEVECQKEALELTRAGLSRVPRSPGLSLLEAQLLFEEGDAQGAWNAVGRQLELDPQNTPGLWLKARVGRRLDKKEEAIQAARMLLRLAPDHEEARALLSEIAPEEHEKGKSAEKEGAEAGRRTITTATLAEIYVKQGYLNKAIHVYRELLEAEPGNQRLEQRLRELEQQIAGPQIAEAAPTSPGEASEPTAEPSREEKLLTVFESWLTAIRQRRSHVH